MQSLYSALCTHVLLPAGDRVAGQRVMKHFRTYEESQYWPVERLNAERDRLLRETVATAYAEVPFYRDLYDRHHVSPGDVRCVEDLWKLPIVTKQMLREAFPGTCTRPTRYRWHDYSTSGSTGAPFIVRNDDDTTSRARALMLLRSTYAGWRPGDRTFQTGMSVPRGPLKAWKDRILRVAYVSVLDLSDEVVDSYLGLIDDRKLEFIAGYASSLYVIAKRAHRLGFNRKLRGAVSWAEEMTATYRDEIRAGFGCGVVDTYGVSEGMQIGAQCKARDGAPFHVFCLHAICQVAGPDGAAAPGEAGEVLLTRLDAGAMPLIRYAVGDVGRSWNGDACDCGRTLPLLGGIVGRSGDVVATASGKHLTSAFFFRVFLHAPVRTIDTFQVSQTAPDRIHVKIVPSAAFEWAHWGWIRSQLTDVDPDLQVSVEAVDRIPPAPSGKHKYVVVPHPLADHVTHVCAMSTARQ